MSSARGTWMAPRQSLGSEVMVSVDTAQPSRPESLWSSSMAMKGGCASTYLRFSRNWSTLSMMRTCTNASVCCTNLIKANRELKFQKTLPPWVACLALKAVQGWHSSENLPCM